MNRGIGIALLVAGIVLIIYGLNASDSISSHVSQTFTGTPTHKTIWLLVGGCVAGIVGAVMIFQRSGKS